MMKLEVNSVQLNVRADNKRDAIRNVGKILVDNGHIAPGYIDSMLSREKVANTFLGNGIAIPHGLPKDRGLILKTGVAILQLPDGVQWNPGETVYLIVGIAALSDEHVDVLTRLTHMLDDEQTVRRLQATADPQDILSCLSGAAIASAKGNLSAALLADFNQFVDVTVTGPHGLHARPATAFVDVAKQFKSTIYVRHRDRVGDAKSLMSLLKLGAGKNADLRIMARGDDAAAALAELARVVREGLEAASGENEDALPAEFDHGWKPDAATQTVSGLCAVPGLAIGPISHYRKRKIVVASTAKDPEVEEKRFYTAIATAQRELDRIYQDVNSRSGAGRAAIFRAHMEFLNDQELLDDTRAHIRQGYSAGWSWQNVIDARVAAMRELDDPVLAGRATDVGDVGNRVLRHLGQVVDDHPVVPIDPVILVAEDLTPSDTASLDPTKILGFCTASGGPTSHTAIISRSLGIPAIVGVGPALLKLGDGMPAILDGGSGNLYLEPGEADLEAAKSVQARLAARQEDEYRPRFEPAFTTDGHRIEVVANIAAAAEAEQAVNGGAEGVGLLRTEFLYLDRSTPPTEEEQYQALSRMVTALGGLPLIIRTLDIGGDKIVSYLNLPLEDSSFLGIRGIRLCLANPSLFRSQLRAIYRVARKGPVKIMFPMIATLEDLEAAKAMADSVRRELSAPEVPLGIMIEVPSAVAMADELAAESDFFSIGTNDLTQYTLAMDRLHPMLAKKADALHPAVLRMIDQTVRAAKKAGIWVGVCGGMATDPLGATLLTGLGVSELSVSIPRVPAIKAHLRNLALAQARSLAQKALACRSADAVRRLSPADA